jgi:hypothetical protein
LKKTLVLPILLILMVPVILLTGADFTVNITAPLINEKNKNSVNATITVTYSGITKKFISDSSLQLPMEALFITGEMPDYKINEKDFLYSGINIDLDNDRDFNDVFTLNKFRGVYYLEEQPIKEVISRYRFNKLAIYSYYNKIIPAGEGGTGSTYIPFIVYKIDYNGKKLTMGLGTAEHPLSFINAQNPCVIVAAIKPVDDISKKPAFSFEGEKNFLTYSNEKIFDEYPDSWLAVVWTTLPLDINKSGKTDLSCTIKNIAKPYALRTWVCLSLDPGTVLRTDAAVTVKH